MSVLSFEINLDEKVQQSYQHASSEEQARLQESINAATQKAILHWRMEQRKKSLAEMKEQEYRDDPWVNFDPEKEGIDLGIPDFAENCDDYLADQELSHGET